MLSKIFVQNYILIDSLEIAFDKNFSVLTGETGSGKSILLGALGLVVGNRADTSALKSDEQKCIVEAVFDIANYDLQHYFEENEIDFDEQTVLRREISPQGKSRAFVNDTPVNLSLLRELGEKLIDIHSQYETLNLSNHEFQLSLIDAVAQCYEKVKEYQQEWYQLSEIQKKIEQLQAKNLEFKGKHDFLTYQYQQLKTAKLQSGELEDLESELKQLNNSELIIGNLSSIVSIAQHDDSGLLIKLNRYEQLISELSDFLPQVSEWKSRIESSRIEIQEVTREVERYIDSFEFDAQRLTQVSERISTLYDLLHKHQKQNIDELLEMQERLEKEISEFESFDLQLEALQKEESAQKSVVTKLAKEISKTRVAVFPEIEQNIVELLKQLGMPQVQFKVGHQLIEPGINGIDEIRLLFSSNKQIAPDEIGKIASGGELSRLMLALKTILSDRLDLPTIIFDEIDIGVSGEIADKMARIMAQMAQNMQVISITHLPQIAAKAHKHYLVYKEIENEISKTKIRMLTDGERIIEIARMLSGEQLGKAAIENARELLSNK
ncbi:MAG TPA: DNA repair protein RecN [Salinivirgaceae bacterium]|nr:DNA repair protein RecN [Salinivirgaceae bacterium]HQA76019.1 DNA repair protein RecN [Salinivirgaceae bacterium]